MSYDIYMVDHGEKLAYAGNYTYNVSPMYVRALGRTLSSFDGMAGREAAPLLAAGVAAMRADPAGYQALNPPPPIPSNAWGDYAGALAYLEEVAKIAAQYPDATVAVW